MRTVGTDELVGPRNVGSGARRALRLGETGGAGYQSASRTTLDTRPGPPNEISSSSSPGGAERPHEPAHVARRPGAGLHERRDVDADPQRPSSRPRATAETA